MFAQMQFVARQIVGSPEVVDCGAQQLFLTLQFFVLRFAAGNIIEKLFDERRHGSIFFGGLYTGAAIGLVIHRNCDIFYFFTVTQKSPDVNRGNTRAAWPARNYDAKASPAQLARSHSAHTQPAPHNAAMPKKARLPNAE